MKNSGTSKAAAGKHKEEMTATGIVAALHANPDGHVDGFHLKDGTEVRFPPYQADALEDLLHHGSSVQVFGRKHVTPSGAIHLHADRIIETSTNQSLERVGGHGPKEHGPKKKHPSPASDDVQRAILQELKAIRILLEAQAAK